MIRDGFLDDYDWFRGHCDQLTYKPTVNEVDGVEYPGISMDIPKFTEIEILYKLQQVVGPITNARMFLRLSLAGDVPPHGAHNDMSMGDLTMILHLTRMEHCKGGTALLTHKEHDLYNDVPEDKLDIWERDTNKYCAWKIKEMFHMKPNRAVIFPSNLMHRAEASNFGDSPENGRLILGCFFSVAV